MWGSHGSHNHVHGPSGDGLRSSAGPDPDYQHLPAAVNTAAAGTAAVTGHSHAAGAAADTVPTGSTHIRMKS